MVEGKTNDLPHTKFQRHPATFEPLKIQKKIPNWRSGSGGDGEWWRAKQTICHTKKGCARAHVLRRPTLNFCKSLANGSLATYQISAQSLKQLPRYGKWGTSARAQVGTCRCTPSLVSVSCLANWFLTTYQISA